MKFGEAPKQSNIIKKLDLKAEEFKFVNILKVDEEYFLNTKTHFVKGVGAIHCLSHHDEDGILVRGECCSTIEGLANQGLWEGATYPAKRYILPAMVFTTVDKSKFQMPVIFARLELTEKDYKALLDELDDADVSPERIPNKILRIKGSQEGEGQYKRVAPKGKVFADFDIEKYPPLVEQAKNFLVSYAELIRSSMGKDLRGEKLVSTIQQSVFKSTEVLQAPAPQVEALPQPQILPSLAPVTLGETINQQVAPPVIQPQIVQQVQPKQPETVGLVLPEANAQKSYDDLESIDLSEVMQDMDDFYN